MYPIRASQPFFRLWYTEKIIFDWHAEVGGVVEVGSIWLGSESGWRRSVSQHTCNAEKLLWNIAGVVLSYPVQDGDLQTDVRLRDTHSRFFLFFSS